jgi:hypothetical protein
VPFVGVAVIVIEYVPAATSVAPTLTVLPVTVNFEPSVPPSAYVPEKPGLAGLITVEIEPTVLPAEPEPATNVTGDKVTEEIVCAPPAGTPVIWIVGLVNGLLVTFPATVEAMICMLYGPGEVSTPLVTMFVPESAKFGALGPVRL